MDSRGVYSLNDGNDRDTGTVKVGMNEGLGREERANTSFCFPGNTSARFTSRVAERRQDLEAEGGASALPERDKVWNLVSCFFFFCWDPSGDKRRSGWRGQGGCMISAFLCVPAQRERRSDG